MPPHDLKAAPGAETGECFPGILPDEQREVTRDSMFHGRLVCRQHRRGYRFSLDSLLAARFCRPAPAAHVLDLGAGCGIIGLILAHLWPHLRLTAVEMQPALAGLARDNARDNGFLRRMRIIEGDLRRIDRLLPPGGCDLVVSNPPYRPLGAARLDERNVERARARHELDAALVDVIHAAAWAVRPRGAVVLVLPAGRAAEACTLLGEERLEAKRLRPVFSDPVAPRAQLVLLEAVKGGGPGLELLPPLYVHAGPDKVYSPEMARWYQAGPLEPDTVPRDDYPKDGAPSCLPAGELHAGPGA